MKKLMIVALILLHGGMTLAAPKVDGKGKKAVAAGTKAKLGTSFKFDGTALRGKYQSSMNTTATVENDKLLDDLLRGRTQFEDRLQEDQTRN